MLRTMTGDADGIGLLEPVGAEQVGADLRAKMPFLRPVVVEAGQAQAVASNVPGAEKQP